MDKSTLMITPQTKIMEVINTYPQLEDILIAYVPAFKKLKNPVLRKTVARVTTLQQVASIGDVKVDVLINLLRKEVGQEFITGTDEVLYEFSQPDWYAEESVTQIFDAREMLSDGEHPVNQVMADIKTLAGGKIYHLIIPFLPAPLMDKTLSIQIDHWIKKSDDDFFNIYFYRSLE